MPLQLQINTIDYSPYLGRLGIGKLVNGTININSNVVVARRDGSIKPIRITKIFGFHGDQQVSIDSASTGEIVAVAGMEDVTVGVTFTDPEDPKPLPLIQIDPPTISMNFIPNDSPFAGQDGKFVTSRHLEERLQRETLADVALQVEQLTDVSRIELGFPYDFYDNPLIVERVYAGTAARIDDHRQIRNLG